MKKLDTLFPISRLKERIFYGWVIVAAFFIISTTNFGIRYSFGVFFKSIESEFDLTRAATSGIFSAYSIFYGAAGLLFGFALDRIGPRRVIFVMGLFSLLSLLSTSQTNAVWQLFITYSLLLALGTAAVYAAMMATISRWFEARRGLAIGIACSGVGLGPVFMAPFATYLISNFDWRMAYLVMGLITGSVVISLSVLLKKDPAQIGALPDGRRVSFNESQSEKKRAETPQVDFSARQAFGTSALWLFEAIWLLWAVCLHMVLTHIVPRVIDAGISPTEAALVLSLISGVSIIGRLAVGWASDRIGKKMSIVVCTLLQSGAMLFLAWSHDLWMFYLFAVVFGFGYGGLSPSGFALIGDTFGIRSLGAITGSLDIGWGIGAAVGPALGGFIFDVSGSYTVAFLVGAFAMLLVALLVIFVRRPIR